MSTLGSLERRRVPRARGTTAHMPGRDVPAPPVDEACRDLPSGADRGTPRAPASTPRRTRRAGVRSPAAPRRLVAGKAAQPAVRSMPTPRFCSSGRTRPRCSRCSPPSSSSTVGKARFASSYGIRRAGSPRPACSLAVVLVPPLGLAVRMSLRDDFAAPAPGSSAPGEVGRLPDGAGRPRRAAFPRHRPCRPARRQGRGACRSGAWGARPRTSAGHGAASCRCRRGRSPASPGRCRPAPTEAASGRVDTPPGSLPTVSVPVGCRGGRCLCAGAGAAGAGSQFA